MSDGLVEQLGTPEEVYRRPSSRFVADFIGDSNFFPATVDRGVAVLADGSRVACGGGRSGQAVLMVRPESIRLDTGEGIAGLVIQTSFLGSRVRVAVQTQASESPVMVALRETASPPHVGDAVSLAWSAEDGIVLEADA